MDLYLAELGLSMTAAAVAGYREVRVARPTAESLRHVLTWPWDAGAQWSKGFLAGVFDADGIQRRGRADRRTPTRPCCAARRTACASSGSTHVSEDARVAAAAGRNRRAAAVLSDR